MPKVVVITGASAGVGRATAHAYGARGDAVALLARSEESLAAAAAEVRERGGRALELPCDVADAAAVEAAAARVEAELGPIDVWVNNAMVTSLSRFEDMDPEEFRRVTDVTYHGVVHGTLTALRRMRPRDRGVVVQIGSSLAYRGIPLQSAYCGAKHAIQGFTESVRCELLHDGSKIHLTMVQLPALNTPQFTMARNRLPRHPMPVPPIYQPEVAADAIVWASEHRRREVWVGASTPSVIIGNALVPTAADWLYIALLAWLCTVYAYSAAVGLMQQFSAFAMNLTVNLEPVYGIVLAFLFFGEKEKMTTGFYLGTLVILLAVLAYPALSRLRTRKVVV